MTDLWYWPGDSEITDFPDPLGIEDQWREWSGTMESGPPVFAEIFSREYIQNSWDSIQSKAKILGTQAYGKPKLRFRFVELEGEAALNFCIKFGLNEHAQRLSIMSQEVREDQRLGDTFLEGPDFSRIRLLVASESLAEGMFGRWDAGDLIEFDPPRMRIALIQSMTGKIGEGTGGSWGQGKKAVASASRARTLAVYSCFPDDTSAPPSQRVDPGVTRRFMGVSYWRPHQSQTKRHRGLGLCGMLNQDSASFSSFEPIVNEVADDFILELRVPDFDVRHVDNPRDHGTSYLFVDPAFDPAELVQAIQRNWWPLIESHQVEIEVLDYQGESLPIHPRSEQALFPFIKAHGIATGLDQKDDASELRSTIRVDSKIAGVLAITSDISEDGWSYQDLENGNCDLIALIRREMVIAYQRFPRKRRRKAPYVRGVFVTTADDEVNRMLKMSEGHLHNEWKENPRDAGNPRVARFAKSVLDDIDQGVKQLRSKISSQPERDGTRIIAFERLFAGNGPSIGRKRPGPKGKVKRDFTIQNASEVSRSYKSTDPTQVKFESTATIALRADHPLEKMQVRIDLGWGVFEESGAKRDNLLMDRNSIVSPEKFSLQDGILIGELTKSPVTVQWSSTFFPTDWQVVPDPAVEGIRVPNAVATGGEV